MNPRTSTLVVLSLLITWAARFESAQAQTPGRLIAVDTALFVSDVDPVPGYAKLYSNGQFADLDFRLRADLQQVMPRSKSGLPTRDLLAGKLPLSIVFVAKDPVQNKPVVIRVLLPRRGKVMGELPHHLDGTKDIVEVILLTHQQATASAAWWSTPVQSPMEQQIAKLAETVLSPLAQILEVGDAGPRGTRPETVRDTMYVLINRIKLPHRRASIQVSTRVSDVVADGSLMAKRALALEQSLMRGDARVSPCALSLATILRERIQTQKSTRLSAQARKALSDSLGVAAARHLDESMCSRESRSEPVLAKARADAVSAVTSQFQSLADPSLEPTTGVTEIKNTPPAYFAFGLAGSAIVSRGGDERVEIKDTIVSDSPLKGLVTAGVVHIYPWGYDETTPYITLGERISMLAGVVITPVPGGLVGAAFHPLRAFGLQLSHGRLMVDTPRPGVSVGQVATSSKEALKRGWTSVWLVGITYSLK